MGGYVGTDFSDVTDDLSCLDSKGRWFVCGYFEGPVLAFKFDTWTKAEVPLARWSAVDQWQTHTSEADYVAQVELARQRIARGDVYQVNVCRLLSAEWRADNSHVVGLYKLLEQYNPAPMSSLLSVSDPKLRKFGLDEVQIASASPEVFLQRRGQVVSSSPIKGTAAPSEDFLEKDVSENIMIVDLVRNDLSKVCDVASVTVPDLLVHENHPGLKHLVSRVEGRLQARATWSDIFAATFPPGSVTGAPKSSALSLIAEVESARNIYCGALGVVDADTHSADLSVAIRTFWKNENRLWFGAGAGITWGSHPEQEWQETELKARHLLSVAARSGEGSR